jgi:hypothetical protein
VDGSGKVLEDIRMARGVEMNMSAGGVAALNIEISSGLHHFQREHHTIATVFGK